MDLAARHAICRDSRRGHLRRRRIDHRVDRILHAERTHPSRDHGNERAEEVRAAAKLLTRIGVEPAIAGMAACTLLVLLGAFMALQAADF